MPVMSGSLARLVCLCACLGLAPGALAEWSSQGLLAGESRVFADDRDPRTRDQGVGLYSRLELDHKASPWRQRARVWGRLDTMDQGRTVLAVEELWAELRMGSYFKLRAGADTVTWTATEGFHPADVLNARNLDSDPENLEKLGEPMLALSFEAGGTSLSAYFMPRHTVPLLASPRSRLNSGLTGLELGPTLRLDRKGRLTEKPWHPQFGLRFQQRIGDADLGLQALQHIDRSQPELLVDPNTLQLRPLFRSVTHVGGTVQQVLGQVVVKAEAAYRKFVRPSEALNAAGGSFVEDRDHVQVAFGLDWGFDDEGGGTSTFILEGQSLFGVDAPLRAQLSLFQRDVLVGFRYALNDIEAREFMALTVIDVERSWEVLTSLTYKQRLGDTWSMSVAIRIVTAPIDRVMDGNTESIEGLELLRDSDHLRLTLIRYF